MCKPGHPLPGTTKICSGAIFASPYSFQAYDAVAQRACAPEGARRERLTDGQPSWGFCCIRAVAPCAVDGEPRAPGGSGALLMLGLKVKGRSGQHEKRSWT